MEFLRILVLPEGLKMDPEKVIVVKQWLMLNNYVTFIPLLDSATFINNLLKGSPMYSTLS
jgi:hypothetical protein